MNDTTEQPPMTPADQALGEKITAAIDTVVDLVVEFGFASADDDDEDDASANALVIAEGTLARILSAYCRAHQTEDITLEERDARAEELLNVSAKHIRSIFAHYWAVIRDAPDPDEPAAT